MSFQQTVKLQQPPGYEGDMATQNPRGSYPAGSEGSFQAGSGGVTIGRFGWIGSDGKTVLNTGTGVPDGFVMRSEQGLVTTYLGETTYVIPQGFPVSLQKTGDFFAKSTVTAAVRGNKAFAKLTDGTMQPGAAGATIAGYVETAWYISGTPTADGTNTIAVGDLAIISKD